MSEIYLKENTPARWKTGKVDASLRVAFVPIKNLSVGRFFKRRFSGGCRCADGHWFS